jgi:hypothetical protein
VNPSVVAVIEKMRPLLFPMSLLSHSLQVSWELDAAFSKSPLLPTPFSSASTLRWKDCSLWHLCVCWGLYMASWLLPDFAVWGQPSESWAYRMPTETHGSTKKCKSVCMCVCACVCTCVLKFMHSLVYTHLNSHSESWGPFPWFTANARHTVTWPKKIREGTRRTC